MSLLGIWITPEHPQFTSGRAKPVKIHFDLKGKIYAQCHLNTWRKGEGLVESSNHEISYVANAEIF